MTHSILDAMLATLAGGRLRNTCSTEAWEPSSGKRMMGSMDNTSAAVRACALQTYRRAMVALQQASVTFAHQPVAFAVRVECVDIYPVAAHSVTARDI